MKTLFKTQLTDVKSTDVEGVGSLRFENGKVYKWVHFKNTTATVAAAAGSLVGYGAVTGYDNSLVVADLSDADAQVLPAGVTLATITGTLATSYYVWIQIKGYTTLDTAITSGADGAPIYLTTTDKTAAKAVEADSAAVYKNVCGIAIDASAKTVALDCPF